MDTPPFTPEELESIEKYFGSDLNELDMERFKTIRNQLRAKYHPDKFEKYEDETVKEMAKERFQEIESLSEKLKSFLESGGSISSPKFNADTDSFLHPNAQYGYEAMQIDIRTPDKDMKYHLFGTQYAWLERGEKFKIPGTNAFLITESSYRGRAMGYTETVRLYLTFGRSDSLATIVDWLFFKIVDRASSLIIEGNVISIDRNEMMQYIRRKSFLEIGTSST
jgi:hypothetical protein